jgi:hypothetical protein
MARLARRHALALPILMASVAILLIGAALSPLGAVGGMLFGGSLMALALWFSTVDVARHTLFAQGLPR